MALIFAFASQMALLGFFHDSYFLFSPGTSHLMVEDYYHQSKGECTWWELRKKEETEKNQQKKLLHCDQELNSQTLSPELSTLSTRPQRPVKANGS